MEVRGKRRPARPASGPLLPVPALSVLRDPDAVSSRVLRIVLERAAAGSRPGSRSDGHVVCLAIEGGGMRGAVTAGMCVVLEAAGLVPAFDRIYGVSAGALNAWATAVGQAALSATHYQDAVNRGVIDRSRALRRRPVIDLDLLFDDVIAARKPLSFDALRSGPEFRALATSLDSLSLRVLARFADAEEALLAVRASASLPRLGGEPTMFRGERLVDGALIEAIPVDTARAEGATDVLVLRSRPAGYRRRRLMQITEALAMRGDARMAELIRARDATYDRVASELERASSADSRPRDRAEIAQVSVPDTARLISRLDPDGGRVVAALQLGARAMAGAVLTQPVELCWQPVVYCTGEPIAVPAPEAAPGIPARSQGDLNVVTTVHQPC